MKYFLGISAFYHDSAAALVAEDGSIVAAAQEERFTRHKHEANFPTQAVRYVVRQLGDGELASVTYYEKPLLKLERILETLHADVAAESTHFVDSMSSMHRQIRMRTYLRKALRSAGVSSWETVPILFSEHHLSHAASAFYPSPFEDAAILTMDGVGEWTTTMIAVGSGAQITVLAEQEFPHSHGLLYSAITAYCGFSVNDGESRLMGLAPYGDLVSASAIVKRLCDDVVSIKDDGSVGLHMDYFDVTSNSTLFRANAWGTLLGFPPRAQGCEITQSYADLAAAAQMILTSVALRLAQTAHALTGKNTLVLAGGVALNCGMNTALASSGIFERVWVQPAAGDAGGALGAAYVGLHLHAGVDRCAAPETMQVCQLGPGFSQADVLAMAGLRGVACTVLDDESAARHVASLLAGGAIIGWFHGRMEWGPRALGNRSILADPRDASMRTRINALIKEREDFRPFAPAVLEEQCAEFFDGVEKSPYMLSLYSVRDWVDVEKPKYQLSRAGADVVASVLPAVTHVDGTSRVQTVSSENHPHFRRLLEEFHLLTGCPVVLNTSFNGKDEPIVCTPDDAYECFKKTGIDYLVMENVIFSQ